MKLELIDGESRIEDVKALFAEYADSLGIDLSYQNYSEEFARLPGKYARPDGRLYLALVDGSPAGCVAMRRLSEFRAEMKRLYVARKGRRLGAGKALVDAIIATAVAKGYTEMRLDTLPSMAAALALYAEAGFERIKPYYASPVPGAVFLAKQLA